MDLITAQNLWKDYNPRLLPLGESELFTEYTDTFSVKHIYFNGTATTDGCMRIYARLYSPATIPSGASVVLMNGADRVFDMTFVNPLIECGHTVLVLDYAGKNGDGMHTLYPESLAFANYHSVGSDFHNYVTDAKKNSHFVYATIMLRGFAYLESISTLDKNRITLFGVNEGAFNVYKAAYMLPSAACAVTVFNSSIIPGINVESEEALLYNTSLSSSVYMPLIKAPLLIVDSSNNHSCSLLESSALYEASTDVCRFMVADHADFMLSKAQMDSIMSYINTMCFSHLGVTATPVLEATNSERALYYAVTVFNHENLKSVKLYYSYDGAIGSFKYWKELKLEHITGGEYLTKADVYRGQPIVNAFAVAEYNDGLILSSEVVTKNAVLMGIAQRDVIKSRMVYNTDMGISDWVISRSSNFGGSIFITDDGNGIDGVTSSVNSITNLKIGDVLSSGEDDKLLQLLVYSNKSQNLRITITDSQNGDVRKHYFCNQRTEFGSWTKITLSADMFRSESGPLDDWDNAKSLTIDSEDTLLINSIIWI